MNSAEFMITSQVTAFLSRLPKSARDDADRRIAETLRADQEFMDELAYYGLYRDSTLEVEV